MIQLEIDNKIIKNNSSMHNYLLSMVIILSRYGLLVGLILSLFICKSIYRLHAN
jgi:hypothetical protein